VGFKNKFDAGELDKWCLGAIDDPAYQRGAARLENFRQLENGGLNRRAGYKFITQILTGTADAAVKLVPVSVDENTNYVVYVSKSKYGFLKFVNGEFAGRVEKDGPAPLYVPPGNVVRHKETDPDAGYKVTEVSGAETSALITEGAEASLVLPAVIESAVVKAGAGVKRSEGLFEGASGFSVSPQYVFAGVDADINQTAGKDGSSYFDETGAGSGLKLVFGAKKTSENNFKAEFTIQSPGLGYTPVEGTTYTWVEIRHERFPEGFIRSKAEVQNGCIDSVESVTYAGSEDDKEADNIAPDYCGEVKGSGGVIHVQTEAVFSTGPSLVITAEVKEPGTGYFAKGQPSPAVNVNLCLNGLAYEYVYSIPCASGTGGALVFEGTTKWVIEVDAKLVKSPPVNGTVYTIEGPAEDVSADVKALVVKNDEYERWDVSVEAVKNEYGESVSSDNWKVGDAYTLADFAGGGVTVIKPVIDYALTITDGGMYKTDPKGVEGTAVFDGAAASVSVLKTSFVKDTCLYDLTNPNTSVYKVEEDETAGMTATYWQRSGGKWVERTQISLPGTDEAVNRLQYVYNGKLTAFAGPGVLPFFLKITETSIEMSGFLIKVTADYELTAPAEFTNKPKNSVADPAVPVNFCKTLADSPTVMYYDGGRWWFASTPNEPSRVWVSKPTADRGDQTLDFSTYKYFLTVTPQFDAFTGESAPNSNQITNVSEGAIGLAKDALDKEVGTGDLKFGVIKARVLSMTYFPSGADVNSAGAFLGLSASNIPRSGEYTASAAASLRADAAHRTAVLKASYSVPYGTGVITASADGYSVTIGASAGGGVLGVGATGFWESGGAGTICEFAGWGQNNVVGYLSDAVMGASIALSLPVTSMWGAVLAAGELMALRAIFNKLIGNDLSALKLSRTDGSTDSAFTGTFIIHSSMLLDKVEYLLAKNKLYEPKQPFVLRRWNVQEDKYSTTGCGFTFTFSSDEEEAVNLITSSRDFFVSTNSSERSLPFTVNGEAQSARTGSFYGSEKLQPAKGKDAVFFVQKGGQRIMRSYWEPDVPVPSIADMQKYNREILRGKKIISLKSSKALPLSVWCVLSDGTAAVLTDAGGFFAWSRIELGGAALMDCASLPVYGDDPLRVLAVKNDGGVFIRAARESPGSPGDVFLDGWQEYTSASVLQMYGPEAVVYDSGTGKTYPVTAAPAPGYGLYAGYKYFSRLRTLPSPRQDLAPARIARVKIRFMESVMPYIKGVPSGGTDKIVAAAAGEKYIDGIADVPVPGSVERDAAFEVFTAEPEPLSVICLYSEEE
jgi:hypothetical protein